MQIRAALALTIGSLEQPVITEYGLSAVLFALHIERHFRGTPLHLTRDWPTRRMFFKRRDELISEGILEEDKDFPPDQVYKILGKSSSDAAEVTCSIDPFAYVSHLSAMAHHGLTDRIPSVLFISKPHSRLWSQFASIAMEKATRGNLIVYNNLHLPKLHQIHVDKIRKYPLVSYSSIHHGAFVNIKGRAMRVSSIGRTFLDMLREPKNCGGMNHVINVFQEFGSQYRRLIIDEVDSHGNQIEKIRAGYLLEEICGISDERISAWASLAKRGGSRKLDPETEYSSEFSERWCLSINTG